MRHHGLDSAGNVTDGTPLWMIPSCRWRIYGPILHEAKTYSEFVLRCVSLGYVNPDQERRYDLSLPLYCRHEPYEDFLYEEACSLRGSGKMNRKARAFRDEMIKEEIEAGERKPDGCLL